MNPTTRSATIALPLALACTLLSAPPARAVEGGLGRPITGMQVTPFAGVIPPTPGMVWQAAYIHYEGDIGASRPVPIGGRLALNLKVDADIGLATGLYIWDTPKSRWNFASMLTIPFIWVDASAGATVGGLGGSVRDNDSGLFDITFAPVIASYHVSEMEHWSFSLYVYAPTGDYETGKLANPGLNNWTFAPTVGYTKLFLKGGLEVSALSSVELYTQNPATDYKNGKVLTLDALTMLRTPSGFGFGAVAGWIEQLSDDSSPTLPASLDGFRGHSLGAGPALSYTHKFEGMGQLDVNFRWMFEFDVTKRFSGNGPQLSFGFHH